LQINITFVFSDEFLKNCTVFPQVYLPV